MVRRCHGADICSDTGFRSKTELRRGHTAVAGAALKRVLVSLVLVSVDTDEQNRQY